MENSTLLLVWQTSREKGDVIDRNTHDHSELVYFLSGSGTFELNGETHAFTEGDFACIPPHVPHQTTHHTATEVMYIRFTGIDDLPCLMLSDRTREMERLLRDLLRETQEQGYNYIDMIALKLRELPILVHRLQHHHPVKKNFEYIVTFLKENYAEKIQLADCARMLHVSYDYFQHKFKALTGLSPQRFLMEQRLLAAERLLKGGTLSCTEIAYRCGFSTSAQFSALFKTRFGVSPLRYAHTKKQNAD